MARARLTGYRRRPHEQTTRPRERVYLDPPFNSNASYNVLFKGPSDNKSDAQIEACDDIRDRAVKLPVRRP